MAFNSIMLKNDAGEPAEVYSIASGLDYPSVGPEHAYLNSIGRTKVGIVKVEFEVGNAQIVGGFLQVSARAFPCLASEQLECRPLIAL